MSQNPPENVIEVASHDLFSSEELMHLDHAMYYLNSKRLDFFHYLLFKDTRMRNGNPPTKEQIDLARKDSQDCDKLLMKIRELRKENANVEARDQ